MSDWATNTEAGMSAELPAILQKMEVQCCTVLDAVREWRIEPNEEKRDQMRIRIERSALQIAREIGVMPDEVHLYNQIIQAQREEIARLTEANVKHYEGQRP